MIPYIKVPDIALPGGLKLHPFGILVATAVMIGSSLAVRRAKKLGYDVVALNSFITWMLIGGFVGGHVFDDLFYHWREIYPVDVSPFQANWDKLFRLWDGLSSFGGFSGALLGILAWKVVEIKSRLEVPTRERNHYGWYEWLGFSVLAGFVIGLVLSGLKGVDWAAQYVPGKAWIWALSLGPVGGFLVRRNYILRRHPTWSIFPFADLILAIFPVAWIFGRAGCASVHDHPGARALGNTMFAVAYPFDKPHAPWRPDAITKLELVWGAYPRYDLGLLELMFTIVLAALFVLTWNRKLPVGSYVVATAFAYAPVRFAMDFLRVAEGKDAGDTRHFGLTFAQWECIALIAIGVGSLIFMRRMKDKGIDLAEKAKESAPVDEEAEPAKY